jgi:hypothetical protein
MTAAVVMTFVGLIAVTAALVMPFRFPFAPDWAVRLHWWGGWASVVGGIICGVVTWLRNSTSS